MPFLYIDIETIPSQLDWVKKEIAEKITAPANYKKAESIEKWFKDNGEDATDDKWRKTSFDGSLGEIVAISWAVDDGAPKVVSRGLGESEAVLLDEFFLELQIDLTDKQNITHEPVWVGHYITGFDLRFLWQRCVLNNIPPSVNIPYAAKPWDRQVFDTKIEWSGMQSTGSGSLDMVSKIMGYEGKGDIDGSKVWDYVKDGRIKEVAGYCKDDVEKCRRLHKRMIFLG